MIDGTTLLIPEKTDAEFEEVFDAWTRAGGSIRRLGKYWIKDEQLAGKQIAIYGNPTFAMVLAQIYERRLLSPDDKLLADLSDKWTKRSITIKTLARLSGEDFPCFIKSVIPKLFPPGIFQDLAAFKKVTAGLQDTEELLLSEIIEPIKAEARVYLMEGQVKDIALYEGNADLDEGRKFIAAFAEEHKDLLPAVVVADIAYLERIGWFILEFNACWGAGLNHCRAAYVIECIRRATTNH